MHSSLQKLFDQIESQREAALASFRSVPTDALNRSPGDGRWSAAQVLSHLLAAEQLSVLYMNKKILGIQDAPRSGPLETAKMVAFIISQRLPGLKFKAPRKVVEHTPAHTTLAEIESAWVNSRNDLRALLDKIPADRLDRKIYKHPAVGYIDVRHALVFFREHAIHHSPQLRKLLPRQ